MFNLKDRVIPLKIIELTSKSSVDVEALIDTGASTRCIPTKIVTELNLKPVKIAEVYTEVGKMKVKQYLVGLQIKDKIYNTTVVELASLDIALIGWDILGTIKNFPNLIETVFGQTLSLLKVIPEFKRNVVLILGQDTSEIHRLYSIRDTLKSIGYDGIIVKEISDIEIQSVEEKVFIDTEIICNHQ
ncbi:retroviral-like aspartic protease family protein [candidate division KSB1 bacterium]|nr:retroviral-like aspartic protease family protein [candidate division KSB1 bacterium]